MSKHKNKVKIGGDDYIYNTIKSKEMFSLFEKHKDEWFRRKAYTYLDKAIKNKEILHDKVFVDYSNYEDKDKRIIHKLLESDSKNRFETFWDIIVKLYEIGKFPKIIDNVVYEEMRRNITTDQLMGNIIKKRLFHNCIIFDDYIRLEICKNYNTSMICSYLEYYITKIMAFKEGLPQEFNDKYIVQEIGMWCQKVGSSHSLMLIITPEHEIAIIDPSSASLKQSGSDIFFDNLYKIYKCLDNKNIKTLNKSYTITCPQLDSAMNIQSMLSVSDDRNGSCAILSNLIAHVMVYMKISSKKAVNLISTTIVRKFLLNIGIDTFADGYLIFLYNLTMYDNTPFISIMKNEKIRYNVDEFLKTVKTFYDKDVNLFEYAKETHIIKKSSIKRSPLRGLYELSPIRQSPVIEQSANTHISKKTPIYSTEGGLIPFKTICPITPISPQSNTKLFLFPDDVKNLDMASLMKRKQLLYKEYVAINYGKQEKIKDFILAKIGEILFVKYKYLNIKDYFKNNSSTFEDSPKLFIIKLGKEYIRSLYTYISYISTEIQLRKEKGSKKKK